ELKSGAMDVPQITQLWPGRSQPARPVFLCERNRVPLLCHGSCCSSPIEPCRSCDTSKPGCCQPSSVAVVCVQECGLRRHAAASSGDPVGTLSLSVASCRTASSHAHMAGHAHLSSRPDCLVQTIDQGNSYGQSSAHV